MILIRTWEKKKTKACKHLNVHVVNHLKQDHAGKNGEYCKHNIVDWSYNSSVKGVKSLQKCINNIN